MPFFEKCIKVLTRGHAGILCAWILSLVMLAGCAGSAQGTVQEPVSAQPDSGFVLYGTYDYDSLDTAILVEKNVEEMTLTFLNTTLGRRYTLGYDGTTGFFDRYGQMISLGQINVGDIVDLRFVKVKRHLAVASLSSSAWVKSSNDQYVFDFVRGEVSIGSEIYKLSDSVFCYSGSEQLLVEELNSVDVLTFRGIDTTVLSVNVDKGHGYLRLSGQEYFVGGWIEIGTKLIQKVTDDMLLTVPEGRYNIAISGSGMTVDRVVEIKRGLETVLDLSDVVPETPKEGMVLFSLTPAEATVYIDGEKADTSAAVSLTYGLHQLMVTCDGYKTLTRYLSVGEESAGISITLEKETDVSGNGSSSSGSSSSGSSSSSGGSTASATDAMSSVYKVYINAPAGAECYVDGNYAGVVPCSFRRETGSHVITLSRSGYNTRSYTISVEDGTGDLSFSFTDLEASTP
ncbi:MAG: PEGA domain-containing protein [Lachnospiraceae bacterium]|nr:PEGA domain-containing protein [Lachnospiraceae bacterium]